ncbi:unnamed protein product [Anisakis simplex]|uniref:Protein YIPF4 n=1 Tax=Anisakis simplex TaxID=6269 RepID=A0A0M3J096_ANISI|nr:unnamed protein product [Anisakis simplex]
MSEGSSVTRENFLACSEQIGRSSPELWPEQLPGAWDMWKNVCFFYYLSYFNGF